MKNLSLMLVVVAVLSACAPTHVAVKPDVKDIHRTVLVLPHDQTNGLKVDIGGTGGALFGLIGGMVEKGINSGRTEDLSKKIPNYDFKNEFFTNYSKIVVLPTSWTIVPLSQVSETNVSKLSQYFSEPSSKIDPIVISDLKNKGVDSVLLVNLEFYGITNSNRSWKSLYTVKATERLLDVDNPQTTLWESSADSYKLIPSTESAVNFSAELKKEPAEIVSAFQNKSNLVINHLAEDLKHHE